MRYQMRTDLVAAGFATVILMGIAYVTFSSATLAVPTVMTNLALAVAVVGVAVTAIGIVFPKPSVVARRPRR